MQQYRTQYPNQFHLLAVTVSKNWWVTKGGAIKYQKKPFDVTLKKLADAERTHIVLFGLGDHTSGVLYGELHASSALPSLAEFLFRAWSPKDDGSPFRGMPEVLSVPRTVETAFPGLKTHLEPLGVTIATPTSGFHAGVWISKAMERWLVFDEGKPMAEGLANAHSMRTIITKEQSRVPGKRKIDLWAEHVPAELLDGPNQTWLAAAREDMMLGEPNNPNNLGTRDARLEIVEDRNERVSPSSQSTQS